MTKIDIKQVSYYCDGCKNTKPKKFLQECSMCGLDFCCDCRYNISEYQKTEKKYSGKIKIIDYICKYCYKKTIQIKTEKSNGKEN